MHDAVVHLTELIRVHCPYILSLTCYLYPFKSSKGLSSTRPSCTHMRQTIPMTELPCMSIYCSALQLQLEYRYCTYMRRPCDDRVVHIIANTLQELESSWSMRPFYSKKSLHSPGSTSSDQICKFVEKYLRCSVCYSQQVHAGATIKKLDTDWTCYRRIRDVLTNFLLFMELFKTG